MVHSWCHYFKKNICLLLPVLIEQATKTMLTYRIYAIRVFTISGTSNCSVWRGWVGVLPVFNSACGYNGCRFRGAGWKDLPVVPILLTQQCFSIGIYNALTLILGVQVEGKHNARRDLGYESRKLKECFWYLWKPYFCNPISSMHDPENVVLLWVILSKPNV